MGRRQYHISQGDWLLRQDERECWNAYQDPSREQRLGAHGGPNHACSGVRLASDGPRDNCADPQMRQEPKERRNAHGIGVLTETFSPENPGEDDGVPQGQ